MPSHEIADMAPYVEGMIHLQVLTLTIFAALPLAIPPAVKADETQPQQSQPILPDDENLKALGDLAQRMMRDLVDRVEPMAEKLRALVDDLDAYEAPEKMPNGDIIIRRKPDAAPTDPDSGKDGISL
jgi:hypothetical protein